MLLQLDDINPPLASLSALLVQERSIMGDHYAEFYEGAQCK
jgi:hypothetical protein